MRKMMVGISLIFFNASCAKASDDPVVNARTSAVTPTRALAANEYPTFHDDYSFKGMKTAIDRQIKRFDQKDMSGTIKLGSKVYPLTKMKSTLLTFRKLIDTFEHCKTIDLEANCFRDINHSIKTRFDIYIPNLVPGDPRYGEPDWAFFTGYHTMPIEGTLKKHPSYPHAIYGNPKNPALNFTRGEIDFQNKLAGRGLEILHTNSLFEIYLLHVQGSGKATIINPDGTKTGMYLNYDGTNGKPHQWISKHMIDKGYINNTSIAAQRKFLRQNPHLHEEIFSTNQSYVYERLTTDLPQGSDSVAVTDGRSIAQDKGLYSFKGLLSFVETTRPEENGQYDLEEEDFSKVKFMKFSRFFIDQDTGGAIKGKGRADIYFGEDLYSQYSAANMKQAGKIYFIMLK
jgi:membrane-bound lytic murein transglycosylase A